MMGAAVTWGIVGAATRWGSDESVQLPVPAPNATQLSVSPLQNAAYKHHVPPRLACVLENEHPSVQFWLQQQQSRPNCHRPCQGTYVQHPSRGRADARCSTSRDGDALGRIVDGCCVRQVHGVLNGADVVGGVVDRHIGHRLQHNLPSKEAQSMSGF
jgi:hypothetical protein